MSSDETAENLLNAAMEMFSLPIGLGMIGSRHAQFAIHNPSQRLPELRSEVWIVIRYQTLGHSMLYDHSS